MIMEPPPDTSWMKMVCVCCLDYDGEHVSRWRKFKDRLRRRRG